MPEVRLKVRDLVLDHDNPRITHAAGQQEALQKIVSDQKTKLVKLAQSIAERGLSPADRLLVLRLNRTPKSFIALEGNRRVAALMLLTRPALITGLDMPGPMKRILERLAKTFKKSVVEPISAYELASRDDARYWLDLRHNVGHEGAGVDPWKALAKRRFDGKPPSVQALELVTERGGLSESEQAAITDKFPISTLERFLEDRKVRKELGLDVKGGKLVTKLPAVEIVKSLRRIVTDLATKKKNVRELITTGDMLKYVREELGPTHLPDMGKERTAERSLDEIPTSEFAKVRPTVARRKLDPSDRREVVPKSCRLNVTDNRIAEIYKELRTLRLDDTPNSIAVMLRVFLEMSIDHFLERSGVGLDETTAGGRTVFKSLQKKLSEAVEILVNVGIPRAQFQAVIRSISVKTSPMNIDLFHQYVHDRFATPMTADLKAAWDHAQPLFERIWA